MVRTLLTFGMTMIFCLALCGCGEPKVEVAGERGTPWLSPHGTRADQDPDSIEYLMAVQRYQRENGRAPAADAKLDW